VKVYNINIAAKLSGVTPFVIRAWEKRYNAVTPGRTETNRRFYTEEDIEKLRLLKLTVDKGNSIGNIAAMPVSTLKEMLVSLERKAEAEKPESGRDSSYFLDLCFRSVENFDDRCLESSLVKASMELSHPVLINEVIFPLLEKIGEGWNNGSLHIAQEHIASAVIRTFLYNLRESYRNFEYSPKILLTTPRGHTHEFGALIASIVAASEGWNSVYLGPDLPASEIIIASARLAPSVVALSFVSSSVSEGMERDLENLKFLPSGVKLVAGGSSCMKYQVLLENLGAVLVSDMNSFRNYLRSF
jgi:methanogenic corrinoid protein MtbC1